MTKPKNAALSLAAISLGFALVACEKEPVPPPAPAPVPVATPISAGTSTAAPVVVAPLPEPVAPVISTDVDNPTPLPSKTLTGVGVKKKLSYYYGFNAGVGTIKLTTTSKNVSSGATQALGFSIHDAKSNRFCFDSSGNTTADKTISLNCIVEKAQPLILRLDLSEETIDYSVTLEGPVELPPPPAPGSGTVIAGAGSTDIDAPTKMAGNRIKGDGVKKPVSYYYAFNAGPGELLITADGQNTSAAVTDALTVGLYSLRSEKLCEHSLGNTTRDKRGVVLCKFDKRQPVILRVDLSAETVDYRVKFEGPYDFEAFAPLKDLTIALDSAVLFDTGSAVLKTEARKTLHEAAERVKKFVDAPVAISGHTDNVGDEASNQTLSASRAAAVQAYFVTAGVAAARLSVKGYGKTQPIADNATEEGRARNRRVDVVISPKK
jgi:outer membrane protein OmpA-like peptidoglycan-associated protein